MKRFARMTVLSAGLIGASLAPADPGARSPEAEVSRLTAPDGAQGDWFGYSVAVDSDTLVVGAKRDDDAGSESGAAYVFAREPASTGSWSFVKKLTAGDAGPSDQFGNSVAISSDTIVIGSTWNNGPAFRAGAVYIFERHHGGADNWGEVSKLTASDAAADDQFGNQVAISGDLVAVAAFGDDDDGHQSGSAYIFARNLGGSGNWGQAAKLTASDAVADDHFGQAIAIDGQTVAVAAWYHAVEATRAGAVYVFERNGTNGWTEVAQLSASDGAAHDQFGKSVAIDRSTIAVGSWWDDDRGHNSGAVYLYERDPTSVNRWDEIQKLVASDGAAEDIFGWSVAMEQGVVVVGAQNADNPLPDSGAAYVFERDANSENLWSQTRKLTGSGLASGDHLGYAVSISGSSVIVGAYAGDDPATDAGSVYVYGAPESRCPGEDFEDEGLTGWNLDGVGHANQFAAEIVDDGGNLELALTSDGATAYYGKDNAGFFYQAVTGDFRVEADIDSKTMTAGKPWRKAGLMARASLDHLDLRLLAMLAPVQERLQFVAREEYAGPGNVKVATEVHDAPAAVRLAIERNSQVLSVQYSVDGGATWITPTTGLGGSIEVVDLPETLLVGLAMVSNDVSVASMALFDNVSICQAP